jgi:hypothetical protein
LDPCPRTLLQITLARILDLKLMCFAHTASDCPSQWLHFGSSVRNYYEDCLDMIGAENMPPNNIVNKQLYHQMTMVLGFIRCKEHAWCVQTGIRVNKPSDEYMGHRLGA